MEAYKFPSEPLARAQSMVVGPHYRFTMINDVVLRYEWSEDGIFEDRASTFVINRNFPTPAFRVEEKPNQLDIITPSFHLTYDKQQPSPQGLVVTFASKLTEWGGEWRYGTPPEQNLGGTARTLDWVDGRCDMGAGVLSRAGYASIDDSKSALFDGAGFITVRRPGVRVDGYLFCYGADFKGAMKAFYDISGHQPVLPRWALGNWWSRYHRYTESEYLGVMDRFRAEDVPLSVAVIDMDWHVVSGDEVPHVGWTGYTWNKDLFPDPEAFAKALHDRGLKMTLNDHPHAGVHCHEEIYDEVAAILGHDTTNRLPIQFDPTDPKFMHAFLNTVHRRLEEQGCDFWWIDWQQGSFTRIPGLDPLWLLNHFHFLDHQINGTRSGSRPLVFSRYADVGSHRYPVGFSGDCHSTWASLEFQPEFTATASNVGYGWWSHDLGGHKDGSRDDELAARWVQFGAFSPILRLHSTNSRWMSKEPWRYRGENNESMRYAMQFRHRLVPYIYSMNAAEIPMPLLQPLYWNFPSRDEAYRHLNQYYFGPSLVVAPVVHPRDKRTNMAKVTVWVPPGRHVDIFNGYVYDGDRQFDMYRPLQTLPVLAAQGSIVPLDGELAPANGCANPVGFEVLVVVGSDGAFTILEDVQDDNKPTTTESIQRSIQISYDQAVGRLETIAAGKEWTFRFISMVTDPAQVKVLVDGSLSAEARVSVETSPNLPGIVVKFPSGLSDESVLAVELGSDPQLSILDQTETISELLVDFQIEMVLKDKIWETLREAQPTPVKIGRLLSLGLEEEVLGPLVELLLADSRAAYGGCSEAQDRM
ncbi:Fc.00g095700.m01.CDS01 [Cosmosporella sp. VM-42]